MYMITNPIRIYLLNICYFSTMLHFKIYIIYKYTFPIATHFYLNSTYLDILSEYNK